MSECKPIESGIYLGDCCSVFKGLDDGCVDLFVSDPPYNIGYKYDQYCDRRDDYVEWCREWLVEANRLLSPSGSLYLITGGEYQAELNLVLKSFDLKWRNTICWRYGFGQATKRKFARCSTFIHYFVRGDFKFNGDSVRVPSDRMLKYGDKRAHPLGKIPDDVWLDIPRLCGTFKERIKDEDGSAHPCQLPESLLHRIVSVSSDPGDLVCDFFCGTGTTGKVCQDLGRRFITSDISEKYVSLAAARVFGNRARFIGK